MYLKQSKKHWIINLLIPLIMLAGCHVMLIGAYDQVTDESIQKIQSEVSSLIVTIENNISAGDEDSNKFENFKTTYNNLEGELESIKIRCSALPKYNIVIRQINSFDSTIHKLEEFHKLGINKSDTTNIRIIKETIELDFNNMVRLQNALKREKTGK